jgi:hypothetical protein
MEFQSCLASLRVKAFIPIIVYVKRTPVNKQIICPSEEHRVALQSLLTLTAAQLHYLLTLSALGVVLLALGGVYRKVVAGFGV